MLKLVFLVPLLSLAAAFPASSVAAKPKYCESPGPLQSITAVRLKCSKAERVFKNYFKDHVPPKGWKCRKKTDYMGYTITCRKSTHKAIYRSNKA